MVFLDGGRSRGEMVEEKVFVEGGSARVGRTFAYDTFLIDTKNTRIKIEVDHEITIRLIYSRVDLTT
jgi:hypothetical protein